MTAPAMDMLKIGIVLYRESFLAMMGQLSMLGADQMPTEWRNEGGGWVVRISLRTMTRVVSVIPTFWIWTLVSVDL